MTQKFFGQKCNTGIKNADLESVEKVAKKTYYFHYCRQKFSAYNFFWVNFFSLFSTDSNSASNLAFNDTNIYAYISTFR